MKSTTAGRPAVVRFSHFLGWLGLLGRGRGENQERTGGGGQEFTGPPENASLGEDDPRSRLGHGPLGPEYAVLEGDGAEVADGEVDDV